MSSVQPVPSPIPLEGAYNIRELGGYRTRSGQRTRKYVYLRGDGIGKLSEADKDLLYQYGVRQIVDLRTRQEVVRLPDALFGFRDIQYRNISLSDQIHDNDGGQFPNTMGEMYAGLLDNSQLALRQVFEVLTDDFPGVTLFHCTAGKDRAGTVAMLLLQLAGVEDDSIVSDYSATERNMPHWDMLRQLACTELGVSLPEHIFRSQPENMKYLLSHLKAYYGTAEQYLLKIGLSPDRIVKLKNRFID